MDLPIPDNVIYAGLFGCVLALIVATAQQNWQPRVFFLLLLRIAIGWQFMSEGLNKIQSHRVGPAGSSKPFSSEPYFQEADGPIAPLMRKATLDDPEQNLYQLVRPVAAPRTVGDVLGAEALAAVQADFTQPGPARSVAQVYTRNPPPDMPATEWSAFYAKSVAALPLDGNGARFLADYPNSAPAWASIDKQILAHVPPGAEAHFQHYATQLDGNTPALATLDAARRLYARWALGLDAEIVKKKYVSGDVVQNVPTRMTAYENRKAEFEALKARRTVNVGRSTLFTRVAEAKKDMTTVRTELLVEANELLSTAREDLSKFGKPIEELPAREKLIGLVDRGTMWMLTIAGACLIFGLFTRTAAVVCGGFLIMTYLTYPAFPWLPNPPGTEGNPVFVNKNLIEALACFVLAALPTGRWLGIDALIQYCLTGKKDRATR